MNIAFRSWLYDFLYIMADQLIKKRDPCQIGRDIYERVRCSRYPNYAVILSCCAGCKFLGSNGCMTKCIGCKLSLCGDASDNNPDLYKILIKMRDIAWKYNLRGIRMSKKEVFDHIKKFERLTLGKTA